MRHFIVLGFASCSQKDKGEALYLGCDRAEAIKEVNTPSANYVRRELYELAVPEIRRHSSLPVEKEAVPAGNQKKKVSGPKKGKG